MENGLIFFITDSVEKVAGILSKKIGAHLKAGQKVLWLVSGGSAIDIAVATAKLLNSNENNRLCVSLIDERYGQTGHSESNWQQLVAKGFSVDGAQLHPVLDGQKFELSITQFNDFIEKVLINYDYKIALLGIGADGHTAGILPNSPAVTSNEYVSGYQGPDYRRITLTPKALARMDEAIVFAQGEAKALALNNLRLDLSISQQPAQVIKQIPLSSVYSNLEGELI